MSNSQSVEPCWPESSQDSQKKLVCQESLPAVNGDSQGSAPAYVFQRLSQASEESLPDTEHLSQLTNSGSDVSSRDSNPLSVPVITTEDSPSRYFNNVCDSTSVPDSTTVALDLVKGISQAEQFQSVVDLPASSTTIVDPAFVTPPMASKRFFVPAEGAPMKKRRIINRGVVRDLNKIHFAHEPMPAFTPSLPLHLLTVSARNSKIRIIEQKFDTGVIDCRRVGVVLHVDVIYPLLKDLRRVLVDFFYVMLMDNMYTTAGMLLYTEVIDLFTKYATTVDFTRVFRSGSMDARATELLGTHAIFNERVAPWYLFYSFNNLFIDKNCEATTLLNKMDLGDANTTDELRPFVEKTVDEFLGFVYNESPESHVYFIVNQHTTYLCPVLQTALSSIDNVLCFDAPAVTLYLVELIVKEYMLRPDASLQTFNGPEVNKWREAYDAMIDSFVLLWGVFVKTEVCFVFFMFYCYFLS